MPDSVFNVVGILAWKASKYVPRKLIYTTRSRRAAGTNPYPPARTNKPPDLNIQDTTRVRSPVDRGIERGRERGCIGHPRSSYTVRQFDCNLIRVKESFP